MGTKMDEVFYEILRIVEDITCISASDIVSSNMMDKVDARHILVNLLSVHGFTDTDISRYLKISRPGVCSIRNNFKYRRKRYFVDAYYKEALRRIQLSNKPVME